MKKTTILILILLTAACSKKMNTLEQDYYTIIHDIVPLHEEFTEKSSEPVYKLRDALEKGTEFDVDKAISDIEKVQNDTKQIITKKAKNIKSEAGKKYINTKIEYIDNVCIFSLNTLNNFKNLQEKSMRTFVGILASDVAVSGEKIDNLLKEEERILKEIESMVDKK